MTARRLAFICGAIGLVLSGCASNLKTSADTAVIADLTTTGVGISTGIVAEANPLLGSPAAIVASGVVRLVLINHIDKQPEPQRTNNLSGINAITWGIAASNLAILVSAANPVGAIVGLTTTIAIWRSTEDERRFAKSCEYLRREEPLLVCKFNK